MTILRQTGAQPFAASSGPNRTSGSFPHYRLDRIPSQSQMGAQRASAWFGGPYPHPPSGDKYGVFRGLRHRNRCKNMKTGYLFADLRKQRIYASAEVEIGDSFLDSGPRPPRDPPETQLPRVSSSLLG